MVPQAVASCPFIHLLRFIDTKWSRGGVRSSPSLFPQNLPSYYDNRSRPLELPLPSWKSDLAFILKTAHTQMWNIQTTGSTAAKAARSYFQRALYPRVPRPSSRTSSNSSTTTACHLGGDVAAPRPDIIEPNDQSTDKPYTNIIPFLPEAVDPVPTGPQYAVAKMGDEQYDLEACQWDFDHGESPPSGWIRLTSPCGRPYFWHEERRALTHEWMPTPTIAHCVDSVVEEFFSELYDPAEHHLPENCQLVIGLEPLPALEFEGYYAAYYYFVHRRRNVYSGWRGIRWRTGWRRWE